MKPQLWSELFNLHRTIKAERKRGRWGQYMAEVNPEWRDKINNFISANGSIYYN